jgi:hypothetical protein
VRNTTYSTMPLDPSPFYAFTGAFVGLIEGFYSQLLQILSLRTSLVSSKAVNHASKPHVAIAYKKKRTVKPAPPPINPPTSAKPKNTAEPITPPTMTPVPSTIKVSEALDGAPNSNHHHQKKKRRPRKKTAANGSVNSSASANNN